ncbi:MAG: peptidylprolyl isomerase, partial [Candidatus Omnitrophica bacterium]|nr:peptidylprolyl isomerase [Candidatus Omnitrophota bacterium]
QVQQFLVRQSRESWIDEFLLQPTSQKQVEEYIEKNPDLQDQSGAIEIQLILIRVPAEADLSKEAILRAKAEKILIKARAGENFDTLVEAHSDHEQSKPDGGVLKLSSRTTPFPEFAPVFDTEAGKVYPELIHMPAGFAIVKVRSKQSLFNVARRAMAIEKVEKALDELRQKATILYDEKLFSKPFGSGS